MDAANAAFVGDEAGEGDLRSTGEGERRLVLGDDDFLGDNDFDGDLTDLADLAVCDAAAGRILVETVGGNDETCATREGEGKSSSYIASSGAGASARSFIRIDRDTFAVLRVAERCCKDT